MNTKKKLIIIVLCVILTILFITGVVFFFKKDTNDVSVEDKTNINITKVLNYDGYEIINSIDNLVIIKNSESIKILNKKGSELASFPNDIGFSYEKMVGGEIASLLCPFDKYIIYDKDSNKVIESDDELLLLNDDISKTAYYIKGKNLYNLKNELIYENLFDGKLDKNNFKLYGDYLESCHGNCELIDIRSKKSTMLVLVMIMIF